MNDWHNIHITDKSGKEMFKTTASPMSTLSEIKNLKQHIDAAKANPTAYSFLDTATAVIVLDGEVYSEQVSTLSADDIDNMLAELGL